MTIQEIIKGYKLKDKEDCWLHKQSGKLLLTHEAHEKIARAESLRVKEIKVIHMTDTSVRFLVTMVKAYKKDGKWTVEDDTISVGEADTNNSFNAYLGCMAEKRGFDRCVRKLLNITDVAFSEEDFTDKANQTYATNFSISANQRDWGHREINKLQKIENELNTLRGDELIDAFERETKTLEGLKSNDEFSNFVFGIKDKCKQLKEEIENYENK